MSDYTIRIKHDAPSAEDYNQRKDAKHDAEMNLVRKGFGLLDSSVERVLDAPCGVGRATILLASMGYDTTGVDLGIGAVEVAQRELENSKLDGRVEIGNLENFAYADGFFDAILCFRVYHHFPNDGVRDRVVAELCRVAKDNGLISYFSPFSVTSIKRNLREKLNIKKSIQYSTSLESLCKKFAGHGFSLVQDIPQQLFLHTLHLAVFKRD